MELKPPTSKKDEVDPLNKESGYKMLNIYEQRYVFFRERKKAIIFRILAVIATGFNIYSIYKKYEREHYLWVAISAIFLISPTVFGSVYSLWCEVIEKHASMKKKLGSKESADPNRCSPVVMHGSVQDFMDECVTLDLEKYDDEIAGSSTQKINHPKKKMSVAFDIKSSPTAKKVRGTYVQPGIMDPKMNEEFDEAFESKTSCRLPTIPVKEFLSSIFKCSWPMVVTHFLLIPKEYHFFRTSFILNKYLQQRIHPEAEKKIEESSIKKVSYQTLWNEFCYREIISKQISLIIATFQSLPMTLIDLLYWSAKSENIANNTKSSFFDVKNVSGQQFNILELVSLIINIMHISFRLVSLMNQIRRINFAKQDMTLFHLIYLTLVYFLLLSSRVLSICFIACLNWSSFIFTLSILFVQFMTSNLVSWNLYVEGNKITLFISNLLMILLYVPPKSRNHRKMSLLGYYVIILTEMILMFIFGYYQLQSDSKISSNIFVVGQKIPVTSFYYGFLCSFMLMVIGIILNSEVLSRFLFIVDESMKREEIRNNLNAVNELYGTDYQIITGIYGQDSESFSLQKTIHLF